MAALSDADFEAQVRDLPPAEQATLRQMRAQVLANRIAVSNRNGFVGYITREAHSAPLPGSRADLFPVVDSDGVLVAYWGGEIGVIDKALVDSGDPLDFAALKASAMTVRPEPGATVAAPAG